MSLYTDTHTMEYSAMRKEILPFVTWMDLEGIMLNKSKKSKYCMISRMENLKKADLIERESRMLVTKGWGVRDMRRC